MNRLFCAALAIASIFLVVILSVSAGASESFPAGVRISATSRPVIEFGIAAVGPSVLWISAEAGDLRRLEISTAEASSGMNAVNGRASLLIPIHATGTVMVKIETLGGGEPVVVTSSYGIGEIVRNPLVINPVEPSATPPSPAAPPQPAVKPVAALAMETGVAAIPPIPPLPPVETAPAPVVAAPPPVPAAPPPPEPIVPAASRRTLFVGEEAHGKLGTDGLETFRFYVPNRLGFTVTIDGHCYVRLASEAGGYDRTDFAPTSPKTLSVSAPNEGHYLLTVRGSGDYRVLVEVVR